MSDLTDPSAPREPDDVVEAVELDTELVLGALFTSQRDFTTIDLPDGPAVLGGGSDGDSTAVAWTWSGLFDRAVQGIQPSGATIEVEGVTVVTGRAGDREYRRYIDWSDVQAQMGLSVVTKPVRT